MGGDPIQHAAEKARIDPEHHQPEADHAHGAVEKLAIEAEAPFEHSGQRKGGRQCGPDRQQLACHAADDAGVGAHHDPCQYIENNNAQRHQKCIVHDHANKARKPLVRRQCAIRVDRTAATRGHKAQHDLHRDRNRQNSHRESKEEIERRQRARPGEWVHVSALPYEMRMRGLRKT